MELLCEKRKQLNKFVKAKTDFTSNREPIPNWKHKTGVGRIKHINGQIQ